MPVKKKAKTPPPVAMLSIQLLAKKGEDGTFSAPDEFRIFKAGHNDSTKGVFKFSDASATEVMRRAKLHGNDCCIDYGHGMLAFFALDPSESGKAAGWFTPEVREGELWASKVSWTPKASLAIANREWRYISPAFNHDQSGEINELVNVAITNIPAIHDLEPLVASRLGAITDEDPEEPQMNWKQLLAMLSLGETATEVEAMAALSVIIRPNADLLALTGKPNAAEALSVVKAWKVAAEDLPKAHAELTALKASTEDNEKQALIDEGKRSGKVPPAYEPFLKTQSLSQLKDFLKVAAPVAGGAGGTRPASAPNDVTQVVVPLSKEALSVANQMGISAEDMAKRVHARGGVVPIEDRTATEQ